MLKNAIDWVYPEWNREAAAFVSYGSAVGARGVQQLRETAIKLQMAPIRSSVHILEEMARGNAVTLIPVHAELTTQEAADMLNISRPSLIQLLDEGKIEFRRVGTHRRVRFEGLMAYKRCADADRRAALAELAAYDQELGI